MALNLLHSNDRKGTYPNSWYAATATQPDPYPTLEGEIRADVCIIGGGYTGLSAALHMAEAGMDVILLDAHRVGFGASGRNGGQLGSGQRLDQEGLEGLIGAAEAQKLWQLGEEAKALVKSLISKHEIDCHLRPGVAWTGTSKRDVAHLHDYAHHLQDHYGYGNVELLTEEECRQMCPSPTYKGGMLDHGAGHLHPLNLALGLARAAAGAGARLHENSEVLEIQEGAELRVKTANGEVRADHLILACNGYLGGLNQQVAAKVMPINNFVVATEPLGEEASRVLRRDIAVADSKFVVNYFRLSHDKRLLFGGGESYGYRFPADIEAVVRKPMTEIFPHLHDVKIDYAWGGTLGITMKRMPYLARLAPNVLSASGYSGHGVGTAIHAGQLMARAVQGEAEGFETMAKIPTPSFPGGPAMRSPLLALAMTWYALRDRIGL
jgi:gamma-glutamylputrescine oxidase